MLAFNARHRFMLRSTLTIAFFMLPCILHDFIVNKILWTREIDFDDIHQVFHMQNFWLVMKKRKKTRKSICCLLIIISEDHDRKCSVFNVYCVWTNEMNMIRGWREQLFILGYLFYMCGYERMISLRLISKNENENMQKICADEREEMTSHLKIDVQLVFVLFFFGQMTWQSTFIQFNDARLKCHGCWIHCCHENYFLIQLLFFL